MSENDASLGWPVSTRTCTTLAHGLLAGLEAVFALQPTGIVLETGGRSGPLPPIEARLRSTGRPLLAVVGPLAAAFPSPAPSLDAADAAVGNEALSLLAGTLAPLSRLRCRRLVVPVGCADVPGAAATRPLLAGSEQPRAMVRGWRERHSGARVAATDRLIRRLDALARRETGVRFLLLADGDPFSLLDLEVAEWILDDLSGRNVALALDLGVLGLQESLVGGAQAEWLDRFGARTELLFLADHDGRSRADLLPGSGLSDWAGLRALLPARVPWVIRADPGVPETFLRGSAAFLGRVLGPPPDPELLR